MLSCSLRQILTLLSECRSRNRDSSDQATFFQSSVVQFWWVCVNCILRVLFLADRSGTRCSPIDSIIKNSNHSGNPLFILLLSGKRFRSMMAKTERLEEELLPSGHQAPKLKLGLITLTWLHLILTILHHPYCCCVYIPVQPVCTSLLHIPAYILLFIKSTVYRPAHFILLHILFFFIYIYVYSLVLCYI